MPHAPGMGPIQDLARAVAPGYWRTKDDLYQIQ